MDFKPLITLKEGRKERRKVRRKEGKKEERKEGINERRKEGEKERRNEGKKERLIVGLECGPAQPSLFSHLYPYSVGYLGYCFLVYTSVWGV